MAKKKSNAKPKVKKIDQFINLQELKDQYKITEEKLVEKINYYVDDELSSDINRVAIFSVSG